MNPTKYFPVFNRKKKLRKDGAGTIHIQVYRDRGQRFFSTGIHVLPEQWDPARWVIDRTDAQDLNERIRRMIHDLEEYEYKARARGETFRLSMLPSRDPVRIDFITYMEREIEQADLSPGTRRQHRSTLNHLINFGKIVSFNDITRANIEKLDKYLRDRNCQQSSIYGTHKRLKKWIRKAVIDGMVARIHTWSSDRPLETETLSGTWIQNPSEDSSRRKSGSNGWTRSGMSFCSAVIRAWHTRRWNPSPRPISRRMKRGSAG